MSGTRKIFVGGTIASLVLSLAIPVTNTAGTSTSAEAVAGVGPKFSKPWLNKNSSKSTVKSYPIPDELKFQREETPSSSAPAETSSQGLSVQEASSRRERREEAGQEKSGNIFTRLVDKITGKDDKASTDASEQFPDEEMVSQPSGNFFEVEPTVEPAAEVPLIKLPAPDEVPLADFILPPQPQPNLLPGIEDAPPEAMKPVITQGVKTDLTNDPFPLPPLPDNFEKNKPTVVKSAQSAAGLLLPPLPGMSVPQEVSAQNTPPASTSSDDSRPSESSSETIASMPPLPGYEATVEKMAEMDLIQEALTDSSGGAITAETLAESAIPDASAARKKGEQGNNLPLAPSTRLVPEEWKDREDSTEPVELVEEQNTPAYRGWRNRQPAMRQEPNALNIPDSARPAEVPDQHAASSNPQEEKYRRIAERGERTGFKGFCPVALRDHLELVDASPEYRTEFEGQVYYFANQECLALFVNDPIRYVPAQGGIDLVKYLEEGSEEPGRLDFAVWYQDRLFLFATQQTLEEFRTEPARFIQGE